MIRLALFYFEAAVLLAVGAALFWILQRVALRLCAGQAARVARIAGMAFVAAGLLPPLWSLVERPGAVERPVQIWAGPAREAAPALVTVSLPAPSLSPRWRVEGRGLFLLGGALGLGAGVALLRLFWQARRLRRLCRSLPVVRRIGRVTVCAADRSAAPFAARVDGRAYIVVPTGMWADPARVRLVVAHEAHHHRRGDLLAARALAVGKALFFWNPAAHLWERLLTRFQELACDRFVVDRRSGEPGAYARCLVWAAELAGAPRFLPVTSMAAPAAFLRRRIEMLLPAKSKARPGWSMVVLAGVLGALVGASFLAHAAVADHRISRARAEAAAARVSAGALPVEVDDTLVAALNQAVATPEGRAQLKKALERMQPHRSMLAEVLAARGLPGELAAVALMESGFDNDAAPAADGSRGAGIWQMIPTSARAHGLRVDRPNRVDDRLDPRRETEAAASMLANLQQRFGDWRLAITAYSRGSTAVDKLVGEAGTRDGRTLQQRGLLGHYLTRVQVGVLVLRDPQLLE